MGFLDVLGPVGDLLGGLGSVAGGLGLGRETPSRYGIAERVAEARAVGVHPALAIGANADYSPVTGGGIDWQQLGEGISSSVGAFSKNAVNEGQRAQIENVESNTQVNYAQKALLDAQRQKLLMDSIPRPSGMAAQSKDYLLWANYYDLNGNFVGRGPHPDIADSEQVLSALGIAGVAAGAGPRGQLDTPLDKFIRKKRKKPGLETYLGGENFVIMP